jgi:hypothetical protein
MSRGFARNDNDDTALGFERPTVAVNQNTVANAIQFKRLALQHCSGMIAQINKAENCLPGITSGALKHAQAVLAALQGTLSVAASGRAAAQWPPVMPKDEEE